MKLHKDLKAAMENRENVIALKLSLKGSFPTEVFELPNLKELYLEGNCEKFPDSLPGLKQLKIFSIKWENFKGDLSSLFSLPHLENLKINATPIKTFLLPLGQVAAPIKSLTIKASGLITLPEEISMLTKVQEMNLSQNNLNSLPFAFRELHMLKRLNLDSNHFQKFPDFIKSMPGLGHLSIDQNDFSEEEKERIQREFHIWPT